MKRNEQRCALAASAEIETRLPDRNALQRFRSAYSSGPCTGLALRRFRGLVRGYYRRHGRSHPWRETTSGYEVLVSEFMLQQTQVARVLPRYESFLRTFPTMGSLAAAPLAAVLREWQGLGYNRRGAALLRCAQQVLEKHGGALPESAGALTALPGIGDYTAAAIQSFVHNKPSVMVETNIRTVMLFCFFPKKRSVAEAEVRAMVEATVDCRSPRSWYYALMDYGAYLKGAGLRTNSRMLGYRPQSKFEGSNRQVRGAVLRHLSQQGKTRSSSLPEHLGIAPERIAAAVCALEREGLLEITRGICRLPA